jgi:hypothetical protein
MGSDLGTTADNFWSAGPEGTTISVRAAGQRSAFGRFIDAASDNIGKGLQALPMAGALGATARIDRAAKGFEIALGLGRHAESGSPYMLRRFTQHVGAKNYGDVFGSWWPGSYEKLQSNLSLMMKDASKIHFNLDGVEMARVRAFMTNPQFSPNNITNWELTQILSHPRLLDKTIFYERGGKIVGIPRP